MLCNSLDNDNKASQRNISLLTFIIWIESANFCDFAKFCCSNPLAKVLKVSSVSHFNYEK
ncbi:hypothetical protein KP22_09050 [Pectobacterium betavasculorum]|uniref:Uncharacterized protein n=1 Tax=Pectobacterium betavasculorum TaxID=55207 RepID=A0A093RZP4_9GAMM|nr:hypothetical protein KP22_09050 [Pectobacterium betavasculorum]